jgi:uncharacterized protein YprB with RNaseH-like and TPR domain
LDLSSKLRRFLPQEEGPKQTKKQVVNLDPFLHGAEVETPYGPCYVVEKIVPIDTNHGHLPFSQVLERSYHGLTVLEPSWNGDFSITDALFLDTETTGLAGGTGTYAFLIGLGYFTPDRFICKQLLMRDYNEELALLYLLDQELGARNTIVSFNGKTFDIPLLQTRYALSRLPLAGFNGHRQLDLLHMSRRLWRQKLESCSLGSLEVNVLGVRRTDDLPGFLIPQRYFDFLTTGNAQLLVDIVRHNLLDIYSMPILLHHLMDTAEQEPNECCCPWEGEALAKLALAREDEDLALAYLSAAGKLCREAEQHVRILKTKAAIYKRQRDYERACQLWYDILSAFESDLYSLEELAKYYEHQARDLPAAGDMAARGLAAALKSKASTVADWRHRLARIERKLQRQAAGK